MPKLPEVLTSEAKKTAVVDDCLALIDAEVADKSGISGLAIKAGYAAVKGVKPGFIKQVVGDLLPEFADALDPLYQQAQTENKPVAAFFDANTSKVADALLAITDAKAQKSKSGVVKGTYDKLRGTAKKNVEAAVPRLGKMIEKHSN
ncbi:hypothetical protein LVJ94_45775 [Pendulispora rubella]|uniref:Uncharacterized protein n=1 Tax=Pendulispora rubella TaxID=2741070 RepID=A0ABZ2L0C6_9BACT